MIADGRIAFDDLVEMLDARDERAKGIDLTDDDYRYKLFTVIALAPDPDEVLEKLSESTGVDSLAVLLRAICVELIRLQSPTVT